MDQFNPLSEKLGAGHFREPDSLGDDAFKIIHCDGYDIARLEREIEGYRRVSHAHVVELRETMTVSLLGQDRAVMVFGYVPGGDLETIIKVRRPAGVELRGLARGLLGGLDAMHDANLLHRDLKPANVALRDGRFSAPVILDLGLAKLLDLESITRYPANVGTVPYMAPEQLRGERALRASDLWAVGVVLFEAATGNHPFLRIGESLTLDEALARMESPPSAPPGIPADVAELIEKCLSDPPHRRGTVRKALSRLT